MFCKTLWNSLGVVKLLYIYSSTKDKLLLEYFIRKIIWKNTSNSSCLFLVFLNIVIRTFFCFLCPGPATTGRGEGRGGGMTHPLFCVTKRKKRNKGKKQRVLMQKLIKDCHQSLNVTVLAILERLEFKNFSCRPTMIADNTFECFMAPPLWNPFRRPCMSMF